MKKGSFRKFLLRMVCSILFLTFCVLLNSCEFFEVENAIDEISHELAIGHGNNYKSTTLLQEAKKKFPDNKKLLKFEEEYWQVQDHGFAIKVLSELSDGDRLYLNSPDFVLDKNGFKDIHFSNEDLNIVFINGLLRKNKTFKTASQKDREKKTEALRIAREERVRIAEEKEIKEFLNSKAGKIWEKHPEWSKEDCKLLAKNQIWIGMTIDMLKYKRGLPDNATPSNYGAGTEWQWCWFDYSPSCFYDKDNDGKIDAYN